MSKHNPNNERIKHEYFGYLKQARRRSEATVDAVAKALNRFEVYTSYRDFKTFRSQQAVGFKERLAEQRGERSGQNLSKSTLEATLAHLKAFFLWLAGQRGYKAKLQYAHADFFNLSEKETRIARARRDQRCPTLEQIRHVVAAMPVDTDVERRNQALMAFIALTGIRDLAAASLKLKHLDLGAQCVYQDAREVRTKFSKTFTTYFFPVGAELLRTLTEYVTWLRVEKLWGNEDPLFPKTRVDLNANKQWTSVGLAREHWTNAGPIRGVFRDAFERAGLPYFHPHSFRHTLVQFGEKVCRTPEDFKAWCQNLGHEGVLTAFYSYGTVSRQRQAEIMRELKVVPAIPGDVEELVKATVRAMQQLEKRSHGEQEDA